MPHVIKLLQKKEATLTFLGAGNTSLAPSFCASSFTASPSTAVSLSLRAEVPSS